MYALSAPRRRRVGTLRTGASGMALTDRAEVRLDSAVIRIEKAGFRDDDEIPPGGQGLVQPEKLSNQSFSPVSLDRSPETPGGDDAESTLAEFVGQKQRRHKSSSSTRPPFLDALEFRPVANPFVGAK